MNHSRVAVVHGKGWGASGCLGASLPSPTRLPQCLCTSLVEDGPVGGASVVGAGGRPLSYRVSSKNSAL